VIPASTYRLQINPAFDLTAATSTVDYLSRLGVGAVYTSPLLTAAPGSTHGYDVVDPTKANPELGGEEGRVALMSTARAAGLGVVVDVVPNHMSVAVPKANPWWWDVLKNGRSSAYAKYFDIDWSRGPILLPVLGSDSLDGLKLADDRLTYDEHEFPVAPGTEGDTPAEVHDRQHYRLIWWRRGNTELTYRRFFDITTLAGVRVEDPEVFAATHGEVLRWVAEGDVTGLRVDHPDGLSDPGGYLRRLRSAAPNAWLVTEKILGPDESTPASWPAEGTTGYDALREICGLFVAPTGEAPLTALATRLGLQPPSPSAAGHPLATAATTSSPATAATPSEAEGGLRPPGIQPSAEHRQYPPTTATPVDNPANSAPFAGQPVDNSPDEPFPSVPSGTL